MDWHDWVGGLGVILILAAYALLQSGRLGTTHLSYSVANALGAALVLVSLSVDFNLAAALIEGVWLLVSMWGIGRWLRRRYSMPSDTNQS